MLFYINNNNKQHFIYSYRRERASERRKDEEKYVFIIERASERANYSRFDWAREEHERISNEMISRAIKQQQQSSN